MNIPKAHHLSASLLLHSVCFKSTSTSILFDYMCSHKNSCNYAKEDLPLIMDSIFSAALHHGTREQETKLIFINWKECEGEKTKEAFR